MSLKRWGWQRSVSTWATRQTFSEEGWTVKLGGSKCRGLSVLSSSSLWPSLILPAWRITLKTLMSPESWPVHQSSPWHSYCSLCPPLPVLPRALFPLNPSCSLQGIQFLAGGKDRERWRDDLCSLFLCFMSRLQCSFYSLLFSLTALEHCLSEDQRQETRGKW